MVVWQGTELFFQQAVLMSVRVILFISLTFQHTRRPDNTWPLLAYNSYQLHSISQKTAQRILVL
jgi:hypothetical protein